ncbi:MAG: helix-turn-helix transcriptional regulator [Treponema sp.]|uniref:helix-turn-helix domain-containing protein n=1 Tax=Treponema sp. TaxID=166 RepID=UPI0025D17156|nr:helix-turn-helix transcriptional regulator [Treponema sp.]MBQ8680603.1 helix-turn-helix transcriptional regulator [Treponema sp.]
MTETEIQKRLSDNIRKYRKLRNLTQGELADAVGMSKEAIKSIECGINWPSKNSLSKLCNFFGIDIYRFFLPTEDVAIYESVPEIRQFLFDNIKGIISDAYKEFREEERGEGK